MEIFFGLHEMKMIFLKLYKSTYVQDLITEEHEKSWKQLGHILV